MNYRFRWPQKASSSGFVIFPNPDNILTLQIGNSKCTIVTLIWLSILDIYIYGYEVFDKREHPTETQT